MRCMHGRCPHEATSTVKIMVPAKDWAIEEHKPLGLIFGVMLCDEHISTVQAVDTLEKNPALKAIYEKMSEGKQPPDFERAFIQPVAISSPEVQTLIEANERTHAKIDQLKIEHAEGEPSSATH